jgi:hypothetical protein
MNVETRLSNLERNSSKPLPAVLHRIELKNTGSTQSLANTVFTTVGASSTGSEQFTVIQNLGTYFTYGTTTGKVTIGATGRYSIYGRVRLDSNTAGRRILSIDRNTTAESIATLNIPSAANPSPNISLGVPSFRLTNGDTIELRVYQDSGSVRTMSASSSTPLYLIIEYLGA